jgi:hypothetical protein
MAGATMCGQQQVNSVQLLATEDEQPEGMLTTLSEAERGEIKRSLV